VERPPASLSSLTYPVVTLNIQPPGGNMSFIKYSILAVGFLTPLASFSDSVPKSFSNSCKVIAFEQMTEWMKGEIFYSIDSITEKPWPNPSEVPTTSIEIRFRDSKGCTGRQMIADCALLSDGAVAAQLVLSDCKGMPAYSSQTKRRL
jgi:hypothetical protein